ncbi:MAG: GGDEF domain-containing protein [Pseudomonadota bacterium]
MSQSLVRHFMSSPVEFVSPETSVEETARKMRDNTFSCLAVCENDKPIGITTERDITRALAEFGSAAASVRIHEIMTHGLVTISTDAFCADALAIQKQNGIRRCVILDPDGRMVGIVTQTDLLRAHARDIEIQKQVLEDRVTERTRELQRLNQRLESLSMIDPMLEIGNRRAMDLALERASGLSSRTGRGYAVALVDVDDFKAYNDHYGHLAGDEALKKLANAISQNIRVADSLFRYGGEEFLVLFPDESLEDAAISAERMRRGVENLAEQHEHSEFGVLSVSVGVAAISRPDDHWERVLKQADNALYAAKSRGKNRTETFHRSETLISTEAKAS